MGWVEEAGFNVPMIYGARVWGDPCPGCGYPWSTSCDEALHLIATAPIRYGELIRGREQAAMVKPDDQTWTPAGYIWHLSDWFRIQGQRIYTISNDPLYRWVPLGFDPAELGDAFGYDRLPATSGLWALQKAAGLFVEAAGQADRSLVFDTGEGDSWTVEELIVWVGHEVIHHDKDIRSGLGLPIEPEVAGRFAQAKGTAVGEASGWNDANRAPPTPGYDYQQSADGIWWARDQKTGALHWHDTATGSWKSYEAPSSESERPSFPYARFWERFGAFVVDFFITGAVGYAIGWVLGATMLDPDAAQEELQSFLLISQGVGVLVGWMYYALMESSRWQATIGKKMVGLQVTDMSGRRIGFGKATGRHFAKFLSAIFLGIGFLMIAWDDKKQGLHDRAASTLVLKRSLNTLNPQLPAP